MDPQVQYKNVLAAQHEKKKAAIDAARAELASNPQNENAKYKLAVAQQEYNQWVGQNEDRLSGLDASYLMPVGSDVDTSGTDAAIESLAEQIPGMMEAYSGMLDRPFEEAKSTALGNLVRRGMSRSGMKSDVLADLAAERSGAESEYGAKLTGGYSDVLAEAEDAAYTRAYEAAQQKMVDAYNRSGQTWDQFWAENQQGMQNMLDEEITNQQNDLNSYIANSQKNMQDYSNQQNAIGNLFGIAGNIAGQGLKSSLTSKTPASSISSGTSYFDYENPYSINKKAQSAFGNYTDLGGL